MKTQSKDARWPGSRKGQAMMEYLMTYGLALFVILIVLVEGARGVPVHAARLHLQPEAPFDSG
jgi:hypothetical protein